MDKSWRILIVCASKKDIHLEYYKNDPLFSNNHYCIFNVGMNPFDSFENLEVINAMKIPGYKSLGRKYAESEVIYNIAKLNLFSEYDFIGLMHYDFNFFDLFSKKTNITELIEKTLDNKINFISFFTGFVQHIVGLYDVLLDERKPNCLFVRDSDLTDPISINSRIISDIRRITGKDVMDLSTYRQNFPIALCCSFLAQRDIFNEIGRIVVDAIDDGYLERFDLENRHRFPGQAIERYVAIYSLLCQKMCFRLDHRFVGGREDLNKHKDAENY